MKNCKNCNYNWFQKLIKCRNCPEQKTIKKNILQVAIQQTNKKIEIDKKTMEIWENENF